MTQITLAPATITKIVSAGKKNFVHIANNTGAAIYICYDGDAAAIAGLTAANGMPIPDQSVIQLNNDGYQNNLFDKDIYAFSTGGGDIRIQGI